MIQSWLVRVLFTRDTLIFCPHKPGAYQLHIKARQMFKVLHDLAPARLSNIFRNSCSANSYHLRNADNKLALPLPKTEFLKKSFSYNGARVWNSVPNEIRNCEALRMFDKLISTYRPNVI